MDGGVGRLLSLATCSETDQCVYICVWVCVYIFIKAQSHRPNGRIAYGSRTNPDFCTSFTRFGGVVRDVQSAHESRTDRVRTALIVLETL